MVAVAVAALVVVAGVGGVVAYVASQNQPRTPARVGVTINSAGQPELLTVQCPGRWIGSAKVLKSPGSGGSVWSASAVGHPGVHDLVMTGPVPAYGINGDLKNVSDDTALELGSVIDDRGVSIGESQILFRKADLRSDGVLVGVNGQDNSLQYLPRSQFAAPLSGC